MKRFTYAATLCILFLTPVQQTLAKVLFSVHGSNTIGSKLAPQLAKGYLLDVHNAKNIHFISSNIAEETTVRGYDQKTNEALDIRIKAHGSSTGFISLDNGDSEICMSSRQIKDKEAVTLSRLGDLTNYKSEITIGLDGIAVITHIRNPINRISRKTLTDIFSGKIKTWGEVSPSFEFSELKNKKITVYSRDNNSGTYDTFKKLVLVKKRKLVSTAKRYESNADLSDDVAKDLTAIGFVSLPNIRKSKALSISDGKSSARAANNLTVATEEYLLSRRLYMYISPHQRNQEAIDFLEYVSHEKGQKNVDIAGYVSQNLYSNEITIPDSYPLEYKNLTSNAKRLSVNIYFNNGSLVPDNRAKRDLIRVADYIKEISPKPKSIMLFGFSEDTELKMFNISMSEARADFIELLLKKQGIVVNRIRGFGSVNKVANNSLIQKNRRVEIWYK